jgi:hypothetical protein
MSNGLSTPPRAGSAEARAITMNEVHITTVTTAASTPTALGDRAASGFFGDGSMRLIIKEPCPAAFLQAA